MSTLCFLLSLYSPADLRAATRPDRRASPSLALDQASRSARCPTVCALAAARCTTSAADRLTRPSTGLSLQMQATPPVPPRDAQQRTGRHMRPDCMRVSAQLCIPRADRRLLLCTRPPAGEVFEPLTPLLAFPSAPTPPIFFTARASSLCTHRALIPAWETYLDSAAPRPHRPPFPVSAPHPPPSCRPPSSSFSSWRCSSRVYRAQRRRQW